MNGSQAQFRPLLLALAIGLSAPAFADDYSDAMAKAKQYVQKNERAAAIIELKNALQAQPNAGDARVLLGQLYLQEGNLPAAEKELNRARELKAPREQWVNPLARTWMLMLKPLDIIEKIAQEPGDSAKLKADVLAYQGLAYLQTGKMADAEKRFVEAVSAQPQHAEGNFGLAQMARLRNELDKARGLLAIAMKSDPSFINNHVLTAEIALAENNKDAAIKAIDQAIALSPQDVRVRIARAEIHMQRDDKKAAWEDINTILAKNEKNPLALFVKARLLLIDSKEDEAIEALNTALVSFGNYAEAQMLLGMIHARRSNYRQADELLRRAVAVQPNNLALLRLLAYTAIGLGNFTDAQEFAEKGLKLNAQDVQLLAMKANILLRKGQLDLAQETMQQAVQLAPDADQLKAGLAVLQIYDGDTKSAVVQLEKAVAGDKTVSVSSALLVSTYLSMNDVAKAEKMAADLYKDSKDALSANLYGMVKLAKNDLAGADVLFNEALKRDPKFFTASINLARSAFARKEFRVAQGRIDEVLKQQPRMAQAALMKAEIFDAMQDRAGALTWLKNAYEMSKTSLSAGEAYIRRLLAEGKAPDALSIAQELVNNVPTAAGAQQLLAMAHIANRNTSSAISALRAAIQLNPKAPAYYLALADLYNSNKEAGAARRVLEDLLRSDRSNPGAHRALVGQDVQEKKFADAHKRAKDIQAQFKDQPFGWHVDGDVFMAEDKPAEAAAQYEKAYRMRPAVQTAGAYVSAMQKLGKMGQAEILLADYLKKFGTAPDASAARLALASVYQVSARADLAIQEYLALDKVNNKDLIVLNNLSWLYAEKGDMAKAREYISRLEALKPDNPSMLDTIGWVNVKIGNTEKGLDYLKQAMTKAPGLLDAQYHAAAAYEKLGKKEEAKRLLTQLLAQKGQFGERAEAEKLMAKLK